MLPSSEIGLIPIPLGFRESDGRGPHLLLEKLHDAVGLLAPRLVLDPGVDVLGVLPEDDHLHELRVAYRRGHAGEPAHRAHAGEEVELLPQRYVERAEATANRRRERSLDRYQVVVNGANGVFRQPGLEPVSRLLARQDFEPHDRPLAAVGFPHRTIEDEPGGAPDIGPGAISLDEWNDGLIRHLEFPAQPCVMRLPVAGAVRWS